MCMYGYGSKKRVYMDRYAVIGTYGTKELGRRVWIGDMDRGYGSGHDQGYGSPLAPGYGSGPYILSGSYINKYIIYMCIYIYVYI